MPACRRHAALPLALLLGAVLGLVLPARADMREISVGGVWITRLDHDAAGYTSFQRAIEVRRSEGGLVLEKAEDAVAEFVATAHEEDQVGNFFL